MNNLVDKSEKGTVFLKSAAVLMKYRDFAILTGLILLAVILSLMFQLPILPSTLLYTLAPSAYLIWRRPALFSNALTGGVALGIAWGVPFDIFAGFNGAWRGTIHTGIMLPSFFNLMPLDIIIVYFSWVFLTVTFYYFFTDTPLPRIRATAFCRSTGWGILTTILLILIIHFIPSLLTIKYAYLLIGLFMLIPAAIIAMQQPALLRNILPIVPFFLTTYLLYELTSLVNNLWQFPGTYLTMVHIFGLRFPLEELIFWCTTNSAVIIVYYSWIFRDQFSKENKTL